MLVIFQEMLYHEVLPTNGKRTLIAMNLDYPKRHLHQTRQVIFNIHNEL